MSANPERPEPDEREVALVTGSTSGIGEGIARRLAAEGMHVIVHSRSSREAGLAIAAEIGGTYLSADLADAVQARGLAEQAVDVCGRLDVLVNNAGVSWPIPHTDLDAVTPEVWHQILDVNLIAPCVLTSATALPLKRSDRGCVVNITSHAGIRPKGSSIPYAASKAALNHVTRLLAAALGPDVRVNAIAPGLVDTPMTATWTDAQETWRQRAPMRRAATPADVADLAVALINSSYATGEVILLDGGLNLV